MRGKFTDSGNGFEDHSMDGSSCNQTTPAESEVDLFALTGLFVKRKRWLIAVVGAVMLMTAVITLLLPNMYKSTATILPSGTADKMSGLKELAGLGELAITEENSSELFPVILRSRLISEVVLNREYSFTHHSKPMRMTLAEYFDQDSPDRLRQALANTTSIGLDKKTGVINIAVETKYPEFSRAILNQYLAELETFNLHKRRSQGKDNAQYLARQLKEMQRELEQAEDSLEQFQLVNRDWATSSDPAITKMLSRQQRDIEVKSKTYLFLCQEYEIAKLDAQKDVPIVRILDQPSLPTEKSGPHRRLAVIISGLVSLFVALFFIVVFEALKKRSMGPDKKSYQALTKDLQRTFPRVTRLVTKGEREKTVKA
jgi:uncharacterized protein involved in exopolysaccharide biosynthesis